MIALMHNMMKNEKIMKDIVMKLRAKIAQIDRQSPLVTWIDKELQKVQPVTTPCKILSLTSVHISGVLNAINTVQLNLLN